MSDHDGLARTPTRSRIGPALAIAIAAFVIGLGLMAYAVRNTPGFFARGTTAATTPAARPTAVPVATVSDADAATLALREAALAAQLTNLEARAARTEGDTADAAVNAGKAEAILVTFAARRALDRGAGLGYLENELRRRFGSNLPQQVATVIRAARQPVTLEDLRESLNTAAPMLLATPSDWWSGIGSELRNLVVIHRADTPSPLPSDRLARARRQIDNGNVETALAEVERLPGAADATNWTAAARRWIEARAALDTLETAAITGAFAPPRVAGSQPAPAQPVTSPTPGAEAALF